MKKTASLLTQTKGLLHHFNLRVKKGLGQHFLIDENTLQTIVSAANLTPADTIVEIGPGLGILTSELAKRAGWVITVELDHKLVSLLNHRLAFFNNVSIINDDILEIEPAALIQEQKARPHPTIGTPHTYKVVANLPYYITSPVLRRFLEASVKPEIMVVMVQKEVAEAIVAKPGKMSILSISVQYYGQPSITSYVPAKCFYPAPEVDSAILKIELYSRPAVTVTDEKGFFELVRAGFSAPRKQIVNSLAQGLELSKADVLLLLEMAGIAPQRRAETLTLNEWAQLQQVSMRVGGITC